MHFDGLIVVIFTVVMLGISVTSHMDQLLYQVDQQEPSTDQYFAKSLEAAIGGTKLYIFYHLCMNDEW